MNINPKSKYLKGRYSKLSQMRKRIAASSVAVIRPDEESKSSRRNDSRDSSTRSRDAKIMAKREAS